MLCRNTVCVRGLGQSQQGSGDCLGCFVQRQVQQCSGEGSGEKTRRRCGRICAKPGQGEFGRRFGYALVRSQVSFNTVLENVLEALVQPGQVQQDLRIFIRGNRAKEFAALNSAAPFRKIWEEKTCGF